MKNLLTNRYGIYLLGAAVIVVTALISLQPPAFSQSRYLSEWPNTNFTKTAIDLDEIRSGGPPKDGIPPIDKPVFLSATENFDWLDLREPVIALEIGGKARAYPIQILMYHEIVNDELSDIPVSVTFCPLCNASIVFDRRVGNKVLDFGTTGKLRMSDLVMWDRQTESWWQQFTGEAIVGEMTGTKLKRVNSVIVSFEDFLTAHPDGEVLSKETGFFRPYGNNPYGGYDNINANPFLFDRKVDPRLRAMERVINITVNNKHKLYAFSDLQESHVVNDEVDSLPVVVLSKAGTLSALDKSDIADSRTVPSAAAYSRVLGDKTLSFEVKDGELKDTDSGSVWNLFGESTDGPMKGSRLANVENGVHFAFAWLAFNPETEIYGQ